MAGDDTQGSGPDLELPSLFRRRDKRAGKKSGRTSGRTSARAAGADDATTARSDASGSGDAPAPDTEELSVTARPVGPGADAPTQPLRPVPGATRRPPTAPPPTAPAATPREPEPTPTDDTVVEGPTAEPAPAPATPAADPTDGPTAASPVAAPVEQPDAPVADEPAAEEPVTEQPPARPPKPTGPPPTPRRRGPDMTWAGPAAGAGAAASAPAPAAEAGPATAVEPRSGRVAVAEASPEASRETDETTADEPAPGRRLPRLRRPSVDLTVPDLSPRVAAAVAGVAVALTGIVLVWLSLQACSTVRGVSSCGGVGLLAIVLTVVAQAAVGTILLGLLGVAQARSTAVLGVGVASFVAMLLLYASLPGPWLSVALLLVTPAAHVLAEGVTSGRFSDDP